ncbi:MAG: hypothetical protein KDA89_19930, partial [Planctomycetaceae bacterium]|nr:hypothetical protein [Planctomycetaceae bacterium]
MLSRVMSVAAMTWTAAAVAPAADPPPQQSQSTVHQELHNIFRQNGQVMPPMRTAYGTSPSQPPIVQVQHRPDRGHNAQAADEERRPGLFKRFWKSITVTEEEAAAQGTGQRPMLTPPPIDYNLKTPTAGRNGQVPAMAAGMQRTVAPSADQTPWLQLGGTPAVPPVQADTQSVQAPIAEPAELRPAVTSMDGFVNPFTDQTAGKSREAAHTLLDLDVLIEEAEAVDRRKTAVRALNPSEVPARQSASAAQEQTRNSDAEPPAGDENESTASSGGPYTGYRLETGRSAEDASRRGNPTHRKSDAEEPEQDVADRQESDEEARPLVIQPEKGSSKTTHKSPFDTESDRADSDTASDTAVDDAGERFLRVPLLEDNGSADGDTGAGDEDGLSIPQPHPHPAQHKSADGSGSVEWQTSRSEKETKQSEQQWHQHSE